MGTKKEEQLSLFDVRPAQPKYKIQACNQYDCNNTVKLIWDESEGIYIGNRTCSHCKRAYRFRYADCL